MNYAHNISLETKWVPESSDTPLSYILELTNDGEHTISEFKLCFSGPARIDPLAKIDGANLDVRLSNHTQLSPPSGFELAPGDKWTITVHGLSYPLRHWSDGANTAYLVLEHENIVPVDVSPTQAVGNNEALLKGAARFPVPAKTPVAVSIIPWPNSVSIEGSRSVPQGLELQPNSEMSEAAAQNFTTLATRLFPVEGLVLDAAEGGFPVRFVDEKNLAPEAYVIEFSESDVEVRATTRTGFFYGLITLGQILRGARQHKKNFVFPTAGKIEDEPSHRWRGSHLDVARQFFSTAEVGQFLCIMAWNKLNRFHWHLSDDEAWRIEIDAYPALTEIGAWRGHGLVMPPLLGSGPERSGGYYTKSNIRELVAQADNYGIMVVPEVDIPCHSYPILRSVPELLDPDETGTYYSVQGFPNNCLNPARDETFQFLETVFDEIIELFPSKIIHIGADEVPIAAWSGSPQALAMLRKLAGDAVADAHAKLTNTISNHEGADEIDGSGAAILQAAFLERIQKFLASRGCVTGGWEEAAHGDVIEKSECYLVGWRSVETSASLAGAGYDVVVSPGQRYYLDMANSTAWSEPGAGWAGWSGPEETYMFNPTEGWTDAQRKQLLGVQACIWCESMTDRAIFDRLVFPRLSAIAEAGWTQHERKSWPRFKALAGMMPILYGNWAK